MKPRLNEKQKTAVTLGNGPALILAGPGSGKTTVILERVGHLIYHENILPEQILVITYTKAAALEMKERGRKKFQDLSEMPVFATFHSFFYSVLKRSYEYQHFSISTEQQRMSILEKLLHLHFKQFQISYHFLKDILSCISKYKNQIDILSDIEKLGFSEADFSFLVQTYSYFQKDQGWMDYDDILLFSYELLKKNRGLLLTLQKQFLHILVDEFQDVNRRQYELLYLLSGKKGNLFVVGDDDQSIYRFRGAGEENLRRFEQDFCVVQKVILDMNYRCPKRIVQVSKQFISHNQKRFEKDYECGKEQQGAILVKAFDNSLEETRFLIEKIRNIMDKGGEIAILTRTNRQLSFFAEMLKKEKIHFYQREKTKPFYENRYVKTIVGYLLFACKIDTSRKTLFTFLNKPVRFIKREAFLEWDEGNRELNQVIAETPSEKKSIECLDKMLKTLENLPPKMAVSYILKVAGFEEYVRENCKSVEEVKEFEDYINELMLRAGMYNNLKEWLSYIRWEERKVCHEVMEKNLENTKVYLYTFHASKGLEFEHVFLPNINDGIVPYGKKLSQDELEEERRMFYVALTRSSENLFITYVDSGTKKDTISPFIKECGLTVSKIRN